MTANKTLMDFTALLLGTLGHRDDEFTSLLYFYSDGIAHTAVMSPTDAVAAAPRMPDTADCYFSVNPVTGPARRNSGRGTEVEVTRLAALWIDLDVKPGACESLDIAKSIIADLGIMLGTRPSAIVYSGGGVQPYWPISDGDDLAIAKPLLKRWGRLVDAVAAKLNVEVDNTYDLSRMLRLPGSVNNKIPGQPRPVTAELDNGGPITLDLLAERLDEWGIFEIPEDTASSAEVIASPDDWVWAEKTCAYVAKLVAGIPSDEPKKGRNPWLLSQKVRLACAHRLGCITEADYTAAVTALEARFTEIVRSPKWGTPRDPKKLEFRDTTNCAIRKAACKSDEQARMELGSKERGPHTHDRDNGQSSDIDTDVDDVRAFKLPDGHRATDVGNAERLVTAARHKLRYVHAGGKWIVYQGGRWIVDDKDALVTEIAKQVPRGLYRLAAKNAANGNPKPVTSGTGRCAPTPPGPSAPPSASPEAPKGSSSTTKTSTPTPGSSTSATAPSTSAPENYTRTTPPTSAPSRHPSTTTPTPQPPCGNNA